MPLTWENRACLESFSSARRSNFEVESTGAYPRIHVDAASVSAVGQAGGVLLTETVRATGLDRALSEALAPWRKPFAVDDPGKVITDLAIALALGAMLSRTSACYVRSSECSDASYPIPHRPARLRLSLWIRVAKDTGLRNLPLHGFDQNRIWCHLVSRPPRPTDPTMGTETTPPPPLKHPRSGRTHRQTHHPAPLQPDARGCNDSRHNQPAPRSRESSRLTPRTPRPPTTQNTPAWKPAQQRRATQCRTRRPESDPHERTDAQPTHPRSPLKDRG